MLLLSCRDTGSLLVHDPSHPNTLRIDVPASFDSFEPASTDVSGSTWVFPLVYSFLFVPDSEGVLKPDLATAWAYDPKTLTWSISLRRDAGFHDGRKVTAADVAYSLNRKIQWAAPSQSSVREIRSVGSDRVDISLRRELPGFLKSIWATEIIPDPGAGGETEADPVGSGPFKITERTAAQVVLAANPDYYGGRPAIDRVIFSYEPDKEKTWARLIGGKIDIATEITPENYGMIQRYRDWFEFAEYTMPRYTCLLFNTHDPLFSDAPVRKALSLALDREYIIDSLLNGYGKIAISPMGIGSPYADPDRSPVPYDPAQALKLLNGAGWERHGRDGYLEKEGGCLEFTLFYFQESRIGESLARYVQLALNEIGVKVHLETMPFDALVKKYSRNTEFQAVITELVGCYCTAESLGAMWCTDGAQKATAGALDVPELNSLMARIREEENPDVQKALLHEFEELFADLQPAALLFHNIALDAVFRGVSLPTTFSLDYEGMCRLRFASLTSK